MALLFSFYYRMRINLFQDTILSWYRHNKRDLPWRKTRDPYKILVSEIMLQQTQVARVLPKYQEFLAAFPTVLSLAKAPDGKLLRLWSGLGYWRRVRFLKETAKAIVKKYNGNFPQDPEMLLTLPGIGSYTAGALACFAFNSAHPFIDTNIRRVYLHFFFPGERHVRDTEIMKVAEKSVWKKDPRTWHYALFDYGAVVLKNKAINKQSRHYSKQSPFAGSFRSYRTQVVKKLLAAPKHKLSQIVILDWLEEELRKGERDYSPEAIINTLLSDKLIKASKVNFTL